MSWDFERVIPAHFDAPIAVREIWGDLGRHGEI